MFYSSQSDNRSSRLLFISNKWVEIFSCLGNLLFASLKILPPQNLTQNTDAWSGVSFIWCCQPLVQHLKPNQTKGVNWWVLANVTARRSSSFMWFEKYHLFTVWVTLVFCHIRCWCFIINSTRGTITLVPYTTKSFPLRFSQGISNWDLQ